MISTEEKDAYFAGLFDGDGSAALYKSKRFTSTKLSLVGTHRPMIQAAYEYFGVGKFTTQKRNGPTMTPRGPINGRQGWIWQVTSKAEFKAVATKMLPFLIEKKQQVRIILEYIDGLIPVDEAISTCKQLKCHEFPIDDPNPPTDPIVIPASTEANAYFAGLFDAEGTIGIYKDKSSERRSLRFALTGTYKPMVLACHDYFDAGGFHQKAPDIIRVDDGEEIWGKQVWSWSCGSKPDCITIGNTLLPYLIEKREQMAIALRFARDEIFGAEAEAACKAAKRFEFTADGFEEYTVRRTGAVAGGANPAAKLGDATWAEIFRRYQAGERSAVLAQEFGVHRTHIPRIIRRYGEMNNG